MLTTKKSPYSQFDSGYYNALRRISFAKAEEYRQQVVQPQKNTIDLGATWTNQLPPETEIRELQLKDPRETINPYTNKKTIDLGAWDVSLVDVGINQHQVRGKEIEEEILAKKTIDLSLLISDPDALAGEEIPDNEENKDVVADVTGDTESQEQKGWEDQEESQEESQEEWSDIDPAVVEHPPLPESEEEKEVKKPKNPHLFKKKVKTEDNA